MLAAVLLVGAALNVLIHMTAWSSGWTRRSSTGSPGSAPRPSLTRASSSPLLTTLTAVMALRIATVLVLVLYRRFRHLVVFLATWWSPTGS